MKVRFSRRSFLGGVAAAQVGGAASGELPWLREAPLREAARTASVEGVLQPRCPHPSGWYPGGPALLISNPDIKASIWGPPERITLSLMKPDVFDRRVGTAPVLTLREVRAGAFAPANKNYNDQPPDRIRPGYGCLVPEGGRRERYAYWAAYPFPCQKPVGQIILGCDSLAGVAPGKLVQSCANGVVSLRAGAAEVRILLSMTRNVFAVNGRFPDAAAPVWMRVYRHRDQAHLVYMTADGRAFVRPAKATPGSREQAVIDYNFEADRAWNGPMDAPAAGRDGRYFWVRQRLPAEKTFPGGFEYVLMGVLGAPSQAEIETTDGRKGLGTPPYAPEGMSRTMDQNYAAIREATGSAATATIAAGKQIDALAYFTVVTVREARDVMAEARKRLDSAVAAGFAGLAKENANWYGELYDRRENGRVFYGASGRGASESIPHVFRSWYCNHGGGCKTDMRKLQASAHYAMPEQDAQSWHSLPCYNEIFYTPAVVRNRADSVDMWRQLVEHWLPAARQNVREMFDMPGAAILHGYLPPVKPDRYVHTNAQLEFCVDSAAQMLKTLWDEWDYSGDPALLKNTLYPALRDLAILYAAYAQQGSDGYYHVIPAVEAEAWGIYPEFSRSKDTISALCMFRWAFLRAAEAAEYLSVDADQRKVWLDMAGRMAPYPTHDAATGKIFSGLPGVPPRWKQGDHPWSIQVYPTTLADEITLDSGEALKAMMIRTAYELPARPNSEVLALLGACRDTVASVSGRAAKKIDDLDVLRDEVNRHPERVLNSRGGRMHLFPCVPAWAAIAFRRFQARGGFAVSAARKPDGVSFVEIEARRDNTCRVMNPWQGSAVEVREEPGGQIVAATVDRANGECVVFAARRGRSYFLSAGGMGRKAP